MALVALDGTPLVIIGAPESFGQPFLGTAAGTATLIDAANEASIAMGQIFTSDGASHTIDTTGSSSLGWLSGALTFANAGTTVKVGLATFDTTTGPPGRATNAANVITFSVSKSLTGGGGGITASAWQEHVPDTGTMTIANGDYVAFCVQMTALGGADAVNVQAQVGSPALSGGFPYITSYLGGTYTGTTLVPNHVITFSDGAFGYYFGGVVYLTGTTTQTWNNTSTTKEYGNYFQMPWPTKVYGMIGRAQFSGNMDCIVYTDPLGTPASGASVSVDLNTVGTGGAVRPFTALFATPLTTTANQPLGCILKPTSATNVSSIYKTFNVSGHQNSESLGANGYAINRNAGAFAAQNSNKDRFCLGLLVGAWDNAVGSGGGLMVNPGMGGGFR